MKEIIGNERVKFYVSPFWRTRQTYLEIQKWFEPNQLEPTYEDPRLREQEWGHKRGKAVNMDHERERNAYGHFYWRFPDGESCADVFDRIGDFLNTMFRDFQREIFPENVIIVSHGMTLRLFLMRFFHYTVEEFESIRNPKNCQWYLMEKSGEKYKLMQELERYEKRHHPYQFPIYTPLPKN